MFKSLGLFLISVLSLTVFSQEVFEYGEKFGVKYNDVVVHSAKYDKVVIRDYFVAGKIGASWYNLSRKSEFSQIPYTKFYYDLNRELLVAGFTAEGKMDVYNETGEFVYMKNGNYDKVRSTADYGSFYDNDLLVVFNNGKMGLYDWPKKVEALPAKYNKLRLHLDCEKSRRLLYLQIEGENIVLSPSGEELFKFNNKSIDDVYLQDKCDGYIIERGNKRGYARKLRSGKYFLIKPLYDEIEFVEGNADLIKVKRGEKYGFYYKNKPILKCKYRKIDITNNGYILGFAYKNYKKLGFDKTGKIVSTTYLEKLET
ncbi:MAG: hypothetical protein BM555_03385 [Crocinitomix sp. MedPE-SWsnd]|nr:MAG: hypothetical protein BM555_03385 [Crocinitomix sp. MedPE-SWsnd]